MGRMTNLWASGGAAVLLAACAAAASCGGGDDGVEPVACAEECPAGTRRASYDSVASGNGVTVASSTCETHCESVVPCVFPNIPTLTAGSYSCAPLAGFSTLVPDVDADFSWAEPGGGGGCANGVKDGAEQGVDCGGPCKACGGAACSNGVKDGSETATDCGGTCGACGAGQPCLVASDCKTGWCRDKGGGTLRCDGFDAPVAVIDAPGAKAVQAFNRPSKPLASLAVSTPTGLALYDSDDSGVFTSQSTVPLAALAGDIRPVIDVSQLAQFVVAGGDTGLVSTYRVDGGGWLQQQAVQLGGPVDRASFLRSSGFAGYAGALRGGGVAVVLLDASGAPAPVVKLDEAHVYTDVQLAESGLAAGGNEVLLVATGPSGLSVARWTLAGGLGPLTLVNSAASGAAGLEDLDFGQDNRREIVAAPSAAGDLSGVLFSEAGGAKELFRVAVPTPGADLHLASAWLVVAGGDAVTFVYAPPGGWSKGPTVKSYSTGAATSVTVGTVYTGNYVDAVFALAGGKVHRFLPAQP